MTYQAEKLRFKLDEDFWTDIDEEGYEHWRITGPDGYDETYPLRYDIARQWIEQELAILNHPDRGKECEHGMDAGLCNGPQHY